MLIDLNTPLDWRSAFRFPIQHRQARREVLIGALWLLLPVVGWWLNLGHRIMLVHHMQHGEPAWPAWREYPELLRHGLTAFGGMLYYYLPSMLLFALADYFGSVLLLLLSGGFALLATLVIPGFMTHYCLHFDRREIYNPWLALQRVRQGGRAYWQAWRIALVALGLSFLGVLLFGFGFLLASVWFWQVAGVSFARVFSQQMQINATQSS